MFEKLKASAASLWAKLHADIADLWKRDKAFLVAFGAIILVIKFREIAIDFLVSSGQKLFTKAQAQSDALQKQETSDNTNANKLVEEAKKLTDSNPTVDDNWNHEK
jgi:hypothetical protein